MRRSSTRGEASSFLLRGSIALSLSLGVFAIGCAPPPDPEPVGQAAEDIKNGTSASEYTEAVTITWDIGQYEYDCSGSLIAPQVVMTAGHCVYGCADDTNPNCQGAIFSNWRIKAPFASNQSAVGVSGATYDWTNTADTVDPSMHDIGLIFLNQPINIATYPTLVSQPVANGTQIVNVGRILNNQVTNSVYEGQAVSVHLSGQYPYDYEAQDIIESGDSGGPDFISGTHTIVSVNSGGGNSEVLARVDLIYSWIQQQIQTNGGTGSAGSTGATGTSSAASGGQTCDDCATSAENGTCAAEYQACGTSADCVGLNNCLAGCAANDQSCDNDCANQFPNGINDFNAFVGCIESACAGPCGAGASSSASAGAGGGSVAAAAGATSTAAVGAGGAAAVGAGGALPAGAGGSGGGTAKTDANNDSGDSGGCAYSPSGEGNAVSLGALALLGLVLARRRRSND